MTVEQEMEALADLLAEDEIVIFIHENKVHARRLNLSVLTPEFFTRLDRILKGD